MMHTSPQHNTDHPAGQIVNRPKIQTLADYVRATGEPLAGNQLVANPCPVTPPMVALAELVKAVAVYEKAGFNHQRFGSEESHAALTKTRVALHHHMAIAKRTIGA